MQELTTSPTLRLSELVQKPPSPKQNFRIMQRASGAYGSRAVYASADDVQDHAASKHQTLEEKQAKYVAAKQRIYGEVLKDSSGALSDAVGGEDDEIRGRRPQRFDEEPDPIPRHTFGSGALPAAVLQPVYPSLYYPPREDQQVHMAPPPPQNHFGLPSFAFPADGLQYAAFPQVSPHLAPSYVSPAEMPNGYTINMQPGRHSYPLHQTFGDPSIHPNAAYMGQPSNGYGTQPWQQAPSAEGYVPAMPPNQQPHMMSGHMVMLPMPMNGHGWSYPHGMPQMMGSGQPMPMIPQGMQPYLSSYPTPPQQGMYQNMVQPTPIRPNPYPHSSSASSISSRSYQDGSRPHSRGSTTSTRSAASSVRLGAMYPAGQPPNYRQRGLKGQGFNGLTSMGLLERRSTRGQSPVGDLMHTYQLKLTATI